MEEENKFVTLLSKHWSKLLLGILAAATIFIFGERYIGKNAAQNTQDLSVAMRLFSQLERGEQLPTESIEILQTTLSKHSHLHPKYEAWLAHRYLSEGRTTEGKKHAERLLSRAHSHLPYYYENYAQGTLLIAEQEFEQAYQKALGLDAQLKGLTDYQMLDALNTLRLLFLADHLGEKKQKEIFWQKLKHHPAYPQIEHIFSEGNITLADFASRIRAD
jgi:hypothetical protein